jgi:hypothetical protein
MNPLKVPIKLYDYTKGGKKYGKILRVHRLFTRVSDRPKIEKVQFIGIAGHPARTILSVARPKDVESVLQMSLIPMKVSGCPIMWSASLRCYGRGTGLQYYIPMTLLNLMGPPSDSAVLTEVTNKDGVGMLIMVLDPRSKESDDGQVPSGNAS